MTASYVWVTVLFVLVLELLVFTLIALVVNPFFAENVLKQSTGQQAQVYALVAAVQGKGSALDPHTTFQPGQPGTLVLPGTNSRQDIPAIPYINTRYPTTQAVTFALLIEPSGQILASSYPDRYPIEVPASTVVPGSTHLINQALAGTAASAIYGTAAGQVFCVTETIWSWKHTPLGAVYLQVPEGAQPDIFWPFAPLLLVSGLLLLIVLVPVGGVFGTMTTRGIVQRIHQLVLVTRQFANGNYASRVPVTRSDEVSHLEEQLNQMADQFVTSIARQQELASYNARLEERARISRELHDAVSQDLFSLRMLSYGVQDKLPADSPLHPSIAAMEQTTTHAIREMRALLLELRPVSLEHLHIAEALEEMARTYRTRLGIAVTTTLIPVSLSLRIEHALLRIAQEALTNAVRHSYATVIRLSLVPQDRMVCLSVTDNGKGFTPPQDQVQHGLGLRLMQERVEELHGIFTLRSAPGEGTHIEVAVLQKEVEHD
ncbi:MAG: sensor histidine kinase [Chloroflexota bacterium]|nr:sensor histidine kinase [Chloroflexota bacterium]